MDEEAAASEHQVQQQREATVTRVQLPQPRPIRAALATQEPNARTPGWPLESTVQ